MRLAQIMLSITAVIWIGYGGWLLFDPTGLRYAGFELSHWSAIVEVQAMYGAVEIMLGVFALLGVLKPERYMHSALLLWVMIYSALVVGQNRGHLPLGRQLCAALRRGLRCPIVTTQAPSGCWNFPRRCCC